MDFLSKSLIVVLIQDGRDRKYICPSGPICSKKVKNSVRSVSILEICKNFWSFGQKCGKNMRKFIVASIPPGRGDQLMPLFAA